MSENKNTTEDLKIAPTAPDVPEEVNPLDAVKDEQKDPTLVNNIVANTTKEDERILEVAPELDKSLLQEVGPQKSLLLVSLKLLFGVLTLLSLGSLIFFTSQLTNKFDFFSSKFNMPSLSKTLKASDEEVIKLQTDINFYSALKTKGYLDEATYYGDSFIKYFEVVNNPTTDPKDQKTAAQELGKLFPKIVSALDLAKLQMVKESTVPVLTLETNENIDPESFFQSELLKKLDDKAAPLADTEDEQAKRDYKNYIITKSVVSNSELKSLILNTDYASMSEKEFYEFLKDFSKKYSNELSVIQRIKDERIMWSDIINEIDLRTIAVDRYYNQNSYDQIGGILYTSYDFDADSQSISIIGEIKRFDTVNFTMIANLIDELNRSDLFANAAMQSFSKSGSLNDGYISSVRLQLDLERDETEDKAASTPADSVPTGLFEGFNQ